MGFSRRKNIQRGWKFFNFLYLTKRKSEEVNNFEKQVTSIQERI